MSGDINNEKEQDEGRSLPVIAREYLEVQKEEIVLKREENALREKEIDNQFKYSMRSLEIQEGLFKTSPTERRKDRWQMVIAGAIAFLLVVAFFVYLFEIGYGNLASELIKVLTGVIFGAGAGYGFGFHKGREHQKKEFEDS